MKQYLITGNIITGLAVLRHITATINFMAERIKELADALELIDNSLEERNE